MNKLAGILSVTMMETIGQTPSFSVFSEIVLSKAKMIKVI